MQAVDKARVLAALRHELEAQLELAQAAQHHAQAGATHEESKPENDKDTRAVEASYLARGQARRVVDLEEAVVKVNALVPRAFSAELPVALGAVVKLEHDAGSLWYLLAPAGGGLSISTGSLVLTVVTPQSPVGKALLGRRVGDDVDIRTPQGVRECFIAALC
ncbi:MAG TPA: GreA/GreB family elongation factor [Polyangiaceae bacterium]